LKKESDAASKERLARLDKGHRRARGAIHKALTRVEARRAKMGDAKAEVRSDQRRTELAQERSARR